MITCETVKVEKKEVTIADIVIMLREGADISTDKIKTGYDQDIDAYTYKDVGVVKFCKNGADTTITLEMKDMVEIVKNLVQ